MAEEVLIATGNRHKLEEIKALLANCPLRLRSLAEFAALPVPVEDGASLAENAVKKAVHYAGLCALPCLADDTGLQVAALEGRPGLHTARYAGPRATGPENCAQLLRELADRPQRVAYFLCVLALARPDGRHRTWTGRCDGEILTAPRGSAGFGYDALFYHPPSGRTYAEMSEAELQRFGHRGQAMGGLLAELEAVRAWLRST